MSTLDLGYVADGDSLACGESAQRDAELVPEREDRTLAANDDHSHLMRDAASVFHIKSGQPVLKLAMITCLASDAGSMAYCSILAMTRSRSRASKRLMSLFALVLHSIYISAPIQKMSAICEHFIKGIIVPPAASVSRPLPSPLCEDVVPFPV